MDKKRAAQLVHDYALGRASLRSLAVRYGISHSTVRRMIMKANKDKPPGGSPPKAPPVTQETAMPEEVSALKEELRKERLKNELLNAVIDIASEELGVNLRKKSGSRPPAGL